MDVKMMMMMMNTRYNSWSETSKVEIRDHDTECDSLFIFVEFQSSQLAPDTILGLKHQRLKYETMIQSVIPYLFLWNFKVHN